MPYMLWLCSCRLASWFRLSASDVAPMMQAREEYLQAAFDAVLAEYGTWPRYFSEGLGLSEAQLVRLKEVLLLPGARRF